MTQAGAIIEAKILGFLDSQQTITTFHYKATNEAPDGAAALQEFLAEFRDNVWNVIRAGLSNALQFVTLTAQAIRPVRYRYETLEPALRAGALVQDSEPSGCAIVVGRHGDKADRKNLGRIFLPGVPTSAVVNSILTAAYVAGNRPFLESAVTATLSPATFGDCTPCLVPAAPAGVPVDVTGAKLNLILRYQRRREVGVGV